MIVRRESPGDAETLRQLFSDVYSDTIFDALHNDRSWIPEMSFVALGESQEVIGHVAATGGQVDTADVLALVAPSVDPAHRGRGVGQALMHSILGAAEARGEPLVGVVAMPPEWYAQFGFVAGEEHSITPSVGGWKPYFQVRPLTGYIPSITGTFSFPDPLQ